MKHVLLWGLDSVEILSQAYNSLYYLNYYLKLYYLKLYYLNYYLKYYLKHIMIWPSTETSQESIRLFLVRDGSTPKFKVQVYVKHRHNSIFVRLRSSLPLCIVILLSINVCIVVN